MMNQELSFSYLFLEANIFVQIIMVLLFILSIISWGIIFWKSYVLYKNQKDIEELKDYNNIEYNVFFNNLSKKINKKTNMEEIFFIGLKKFFDFISSKNNKSVKTSDIDLLLEKSKDKMYIQIDKIESNIKKGISNLATIGSVSPYIGLLGTVIGIMHTFQSLGGVKQATLDMVAPGIAEALIATAIGLIAAIPAYVANNKLTEIADSQLDYYSIFVDYIINDLSLRRFSNQSE